MKISSSTKLYGVIGDPIEHSLSPLMHNAAFRTLGMDCIYLAFRVRSHQLKDAINGIRALGICGVNVTMPHKTSVLSLLDELDITAKVAKSVNTIKNVDGRLIGYNTDGIAALSVLRKHIPDLREKKILLLGAGGVARAIAFNLIGNCKSLTIINRTREKAIELAEMIKKLNFPAVGAELNYENLRRAIQVNDVLINATSVGMYPNTNESLVKKDLLRKDLVIFDVVYNPVETKLLLNGKSIGAKTISGLEMFVEQGAMSFEIWTGKKAPIDVMFRSVYEELAHMKGG